MLQLVSTGLYGTCSRFQAAIRIRRPCKGKRKIPVRDVVSLEVGTGEGWRDHEGAALIVCCLFEMELCSLFGHSLVLLLLLAELFALHLLLLDEFVHLLLQFRIGHGHGLLVGESGPRARVAIEIGCVVVSVSFPLLTASLLRVEQRRSLILLGCFHVANEGISWIIT